MSGQEKRRLDHPEYVKLRGAAETTRPAAEAATAGLLALIAESPSLLRRVAEEIAETFPEDSQAGRVAQDFLAADAAHRVTTGARMKWIDEHPEWR